MQGWIKLHRSISDNDLWLSEPFTYGQAWVDLLANAAHKDTSFFVRGIEIRLNRGDLGWSEVTLSKRWKWSRGKVRRYLGMLKNRGMIVQQTNQATSVISICNYCLYQSENGCTEHQIVQQTEHQVVQQTDSRRYTYKNDKNVKNEKEVKPTSESKIPPCPVEKIISMYQDRCSRLPKLRVIPDKTRTAISSRWRQDTKFQTLDFWESFFDYCNDNKFLSGQSNPRPGSDKPFRADLNWLVKPEPFANIINEKYA